MSAFVISKAHIDAMLAAALDVELRWRGEKLSGDEALHEAGQMLLDECVRSVSERYTDSLDLPGTLDDDGEPEWLRSYEYVRPGRKPTPLEGLKLIDCYEYQSCEHEGWKGSEARRFCDHLREALIEHLPGYDDAPWEWSFEMPVRGQ